MNIAGNLGFKMLSGCLTALIYGIVTGIFQSDVSNKLKNFMSSLIKKDKIIITVI